MPELLKLKEACSVLRISLQAGYRLVWSGKLPSVMVGRSHRIRRDDLAKFLEERRTVVRPC